MKLSADLQSALDASRSVPSDPDVACRAVGLLDLTSLNGDDTERVVEALCARAVTPVGPVAAVCVWPRFVETARRALEGTPVRVATVVNFPTGEADAPSVAAETRRAIDAGAQEIDVVLPYQAFIDGARTQPMSVVRACREACGESTLMKVILESGTYPDPELLAWAARDSIAAGADFLKTSTGKTQPAATLEAAAVMLHTIHDSGKTVGFKASGGIRTADEAVAYLALAEHLLGKGWATPQTFRFGASSLLDALLATCGHGAPDDAKQPATAGY